MNRFLEKRFHEVLSAINLADVREVSQWFQDTTWLTSKLCVSQQWTDGVIGHLYCRALLPDLISHKVSGFESDLSHFVVSSIRLRLQFIKNFLSLTVPIICINKCHVIDASKMQATQCPVGRVQDTNCGQCVALALRAL